MFDALKNLFFKKSNEAENPTLVCTFVCEELNKQYAIYYKSSRDIGFDGKTKLYVVYYEPDKPLTSLTPVTDPDELAMADDVIKQIESAN